MTAVINTFVKNILILVAMSVEEQGILGNYDWKELPVSTQLGITAKTMKVGPHSISILQSGVGEVNAGIAVAMFAEKYPVTEIIQLGIGGSLSPTVIPGNTVVGTVIIQHDSVITSDRGTELMAPGELFLSTALASRVSPLMATDRDLTEKLEQYISPLPHRGVILSGSEFVGSRLRKAELKKQFPEALLVEMESAGIAQIARKLGIPFAVAKTAADGYSPDTSIHDEYLNWKISACRKAEQVINSLAKELGKEQR